MKKIILTLSLVIMLFSIGFSQTETKQTIPDGLYLVIRIDTSAASLLKTNEYAVSYSKMFDEYNNPSEFTRIIIDTSDYVPLELEKTPVSEQQTDTKKKLMLTLTKEASEKLKTFTKKHVMTMVTIVVDGEALTIHKIKTPITNGQLQITRCNDNACEKLLVKLKDNVK